MHERAQHAFGPHLRRVRLQRGLSLEQIAAATKVSKELWDGLEQNDLSRWPGGLYARAYVRAYAIEVGIDPDATIDEFCRCFPAGDRRAGRLVREQAALIGHDLKWRDDLGGAGIERRANAAPTDEPSPVFAKFGRTVAAGGDVLFVLGAATVIAAWCPLRWSSAAAATALLYHALSLVALGATPGAWAVDTYLANRHPSARRSGDAHRLRLLGGSERAKA